MAISTNIPNHTGDETPSKLKADLQSDINTLETEANRVAPMVDAEHNADGTHKEIHTPSIVLNGVQRNTWPSPGSAAVALTDVLTNGEKGNIPAAGRFELRDNTGAKTYFAVDEATGKVTQVNLDGMVGNIRDTLVEIPFKRANDEIRLSGTQTFTRASTGTYIDPLDGLVKTAAVDTPRFERMADGGVGILLEGSSTNYLLQSQDFTQTNWTKMGVTVTGNAVLGPDGATSADTITDDTTAATFHRVVQLGNPIPAGDQTEYVIAKAGTLSHCVVMIHNVTDGIVAYAVFDLANGAIISNPNGTAKIKPMANEYYWCEVNGTATAASDAYFHLHNGTSDVYTGTGTGTIHVWHGQAENLPFGSSIIPTTTAAVTRAADALNLTIGGNRIRSTDDFTILVDFDAPALDAARDAHVLNLGVGESHLLMRARVNWSVYSHIYHGNNNAINAPLFASDTVYRWGWRHSGGTFESWANGSRNASGTSSATVGTATAIRIGGWNGTDLYGHIRNFRIYDRALTDSEMAAA